MHLRNKIVYVVLLLATLLSLSRLFAATVTSVSPGQSIQEAINNASPGDTIEVAFGNYTGRVVIGKNRNGITLDNIILQGAGAGVTFLNISGTGGTAITFDNVSGTAVSGFTIKNADIGIISRKSKANVTNNIFIGNKSAFENRSSFSRVVNNTFSRNTKAVFTDSSSTLKNNIIAGSTRYGVVGSKADSITYNLFHNNVLGNFSGIATPPDSSFNVVGDPDPLFVNDASDFHLRSGSPAIDAGDPDPSFNDAADGTSSDIGVYGGPAADVIPATVTGVSVASARDNVTISWNANLDYRIVNYKVLYGASPGNFTASVDAGDVTSIVLSNLTLNQRFYFSIRAVDGSNHEGLDSASGIFGAIDTLPPTAPANLKADIGDRRLFLSWNAATDNESGVKGYKIYFGTSSGNYGTPVDVGNVTSYELTGLANNTTYFIAVSAVDNAGNEGPKSAEVSQSPEEIRGILGLKDTGGCFIATAAYGSYEERHVKVLREFRDRYLLTNTPGRALVSFYYRTSPPIAGFIRDSETLKAVVRTVLLPLIVVAWLLINHPLLSLVCAGFLFIFLTLTPPIPLFAKEGAQGELKGVKRLTSYVSLLTLFFVLITPAASFGDERSGLSFGLSYGQLEPASDEWKEIYGDDRVSTYRLSLGYRFNRNFGAEAGAGYITKDGKGKTVTGKETGVETTFHAAPVDVTLIYRLNYFDEQVIIPYIGGGMSYNYYWENVKDGKELKGSMWGYHATGGLQLLLDNIDRRSAFDLEEDYWIENTYLTIGATHSIIDDFGGEDVDLGGWNYNIGLLFEF